MFVDTDTPFAAHEQAELFTTYEYDSTNKAIADAKRQYEAKNGVDKRKLTARKFESGWDNKRDVSYRTIVVAPTYSERTY